MRKLILIALTLINVINVLAKEPLILKSGTLTELTNTANTVYFKVDYSNATVHNDGNKYTLDGYLKHRGPDFIADWNKDSAKAYSYIPVRFNQKNKKGAKAIETEGNYDILGTIILTDIDFGNGAGSFNPFGGVKAGGCIISGKLVFSTPSGSEIAVLSFSEIKGMGHVSETIRLGMSYFELMNKLGDIIKNEKK